MNFNIHAWFRLFRPQNAAIAGASVLLGWFSMHPLRPDLAVALWGCLSMLLLVMAGNADNDICDLAVDRVNRPTRPLPAGILKAGQVRIASIFLYGLSFIAAAIATPFHGILVACMVLLLFAYNRRLKGLPLVGNLAVSFLCGLAIYFPEFPSRPWNTLPAFVFAFFATFAREVVKDMEDMEGDRGAGLRTLPLVFSIQAARKLAFSLVAILLAILPLPAAFFGYGRSYLILATVLAAPFLIVLLLELSKPSADYGRCQRYLKWVMIGGMMALWVGVMRR